MNKKLRITLAKHPVKDADVIVKPITIREKFLRMLFGKKVELLFIVPSENIEELAIHSSDN